MPEPVTMTTLAVVLGIHALKGVFANKDWGFDSVESSVAGGALGVLDKILGKAISRKVLKKQLKKAGENARNWLDTEPEFSELRPVIDSVCAEKWPELAAAVKDLRGDLSGTRLRILLRRIFSHAQVEENVRINAAEAFYEALFRALLLVPPFSVQAQRLLLDIDRSRQERIWRKIRVSFEDSFRALLDPECLIHWPYAELPLNDDRLSDLLIAKHQVVPFFGRPNEMDDLLKWCHEGDGVEARLYLGAGGEGKTRFFAQACSLLMNGDYGKWQAGWLDLRRCCAEPARLDALLRFDGGLLLGIDYAGSEVAGAITAANQILSGAPKAKIRLVLLERGKGYWWDRMKSESAVFAQAKEIRLESLGNESDRKRIFDNAFDAFRSVLTKTAEKPADFDLGRDEFANVLFILMAAALAAAGDPSPTAEGILKGLLNHEAKWRERRANSLKLGMDGESLKLAAALGTLVGGSSEKKQTYELLRRTPDFKDEKEIDLEKTCRAIGGSTGGAGCLLPALKPDRLGERLLESIFIDPDESTIADKILSAAFPDKNDQFTRAAFLVLDRMSKRDPHGSWLSRLAATNLVFLLPDYSLELLEFSALLTEKAAAVQPSLIKDESEAKSRYGTLINNLAVCLSDLGRREEALQAAQKAVDIYRDLAAAQPDAFRPNLAMSLSNLANRLSNLGHREEALAAAQKAVDIRRDLAAARPDAFRPDLAMSLSNLANRLSDLGRREEALRAAQEAVEIRRDLAAARPDAFRPDLAMSLNNVATFLSDLGRREEALTAAQEAVEIYRDLAAARPDAFRPDLAMSLNNLANSLSALGRREEALTAAQEAVDIYRDLAAARPDAFRPNLAMSLGAMGQVYVSQENHQAGAECFKEGLATILPFFKRLPTAFVRITAALARDYSEACAKSGIEPDGKVMTEAAEVFQALEKEGEEKDHTEG